MVRLQKPEIMDGRPNTQTNPNAEVIVFVKIVIFMTVYHALVIVFVKIIIFMTVYHALYFQNYADPDLVLASIFCFIVARLRSVRFNAPVAGV